MSLSQCQRQYDDIAEDDAERRADARALKESRADYLADLAEDSE